MLPINIMIDSSINEEDEKSILEGLLEFRDLFPGRDYSFDDTRADRLVANARRIRRQDGSIQIDGNHLLSLMYSHSNQVCDAKIEVLFTSYDMTANDNNFVFGVAWPEGRCTAQSVYRYKGLNSEDRHLVIKGVLLHELGHILGMAANPSRINVEEKLGLHCADWNCIMHQSMTVDDAVYIARGANSRMIYCPLCMNDGRHSNV